jgi:hypothetical protein
MEIAKLGRLGPVYFPGSWSCFIWLELAMIDQLRARLLLGCWRFNWKLLFLENFSCWIWSYSTLRFATESAGSLGTSLDRVTPPESLSLTQCTLSESSIIQVVTSQFWTCDFWFDEKRWMIIWYTGGTGVDSVQVEYRILIQSSFPSRILHLVVEHLNCQDDSTRTSFLDHDEDMRVQRSTRTRIPEL